MGDTSASTNGWGWRHGRYGSERAARATGAVPKPSIVSSRPHKALGFDQRARSLQRVKIDVEGYELNVLRGSEEFVRRNRPTIFGEFSPSWYAARGVSIRQSGNNLTFAASASTIGLPAIWRCDVAYVYHPPMTAALAAECRSYSMYKTCGLTWSPRPASCRPVERNAGLRRPWASCAM
jgi:hypothetical protein